MKSKKGLSRLTYIWWIYLLAAIVIIAFWLTVFNSLAQPKPNEKLLISVAATRVRTEDMENDLTEKISELSDQKLKNITVETIPCDSSYNLTNALFSRSLDADIIIVTHSAMFEGIGVGYFPSMDKEKYKAVFGDVEFFSEKNGNAYGILLCDEQTENNFTKYCSVKEKCWLFISGESPNTAQMNGKGNEADDSAIQTVKWLLSNG